MVESEEEPKSLLVKAREESKKSWLKAQHSKNKDNSIWSQHFMANRWGKMEMVIDYIFLGSKITEDGY